jgi:zinc transporter ZupT
MSEHTTSSSLAEGPALSTAKGLPTEAERATRARPIRSWSLGRVAAAALPLVLLLAVVAIFLSTGAGIQVPAGLPPIEQIDVQQIVLPEPERIVLSIVNSGPDPVTIAQVLVDEAYWQFEVEPDVTIPRFGTATISLPYPWVEAEPHVITLITSTGTTFEADIPLAVQTPVADFNTFLQFALIGVYVGVIPVGLGLMWHPFMRSLKRRWLDAILALTIGLLVFLLIDTASEGLEVAARVPGAFNGLILFAAGGLLAYLLIQIASARPAARRDETSARLSLSYLLAIGIGLHNLAEGLAIGAAYATGEAALGVFLVVGFTLHNITEGIGIAAPVAQDRPRLLTFIWLALIAGLPAIAGAWIGGFIYSDIAAAIFLGVGAGAIVQVIVEVGKLLMQHGQRAGASFATWPNLIGFAAGLVIMYATALLVAV